MGEMTSSTVGENVRRVRKELGLTQEQLAARISEDTSIATVSKIEKGQMKASHAWILRLAKALSVSEHELIARPEGAPMHLVPIIGYIAAGSWSEAIEQPLGWMPMPNGVAGRNAFALQPIGDSMDKYLPRGGYIVVDPDQRRLVDRKLYAVRNGDEETTFKQYCAHPPSLLPCSTNPKHVPFDLGEEPFIVIGQVVWLGYQP